MTDTPVREIRSVIDDSGNIKYTNRVLVGTCVTGLLRVEWVAARYSQIIPMNWSHVEMREALNSFYPLRYPVEHAQNLIVKTAIEQDFEWIFFLEHDVCIPENTFIKLNEYMREAKYPVVSGLYYSRARPSEPLIFRGRGTGVYTDWKHGDLVWADGVPTGCLLVHQSLLKAMWDESPDYFVQKGGGVSPTRRVFSVPQTLWIDPENGNKTSTTGTSDLAWCTRVMNEGFFEKSGWKDFCPDPKYPFLVDTNIFCRHIDIHTGEQFP